MTAPIDLDQVERYATHLKKTDVSTGTCHRAADTLRALAARVVELERELIVPLTESHARLKRERNVYQAGYRALRAKLDAMRTREPTLAEVIQSHELLRRAEAVTDYDEVKQDAARGATECGTPWEDVRKVERERDALRAKLDQEKRQGFAHTAARLMILERENALRRDDGRLMIAERDAIRANAQKLERHNTELQEKVMAMSRECEAAHASFERNVENVLMLERERNAENVLRLERERDALRAKLDAMRTREPSGAEFEAILKITYGTGTMENRYRGFLRYWRDRLLATPEATAQEPSLQDVLDSIEQESTDDPMYARLAAPALVKVLRRKT